MEQIIQRCDLLGLELVPVFFLLCDMFVVLSISEIVLRRSKLKLQSAAETFLALGTIFISCIVLTCIGLGIAGLLDWKNLLITHISIWLVIVFLYKKSSREPTNLFSNSFHCIKNLFAPITSLLDTKNWQKGKKYESILIVLIFLILCIYLILAVFTLPLNYDSNTYRLTRIGYWLQENNIARFIIDDTRQNYMAINTDLVMLWITSFFRYGFPLVHLVQFFGGILCCAAVYEFGRLFSFSKILRLASVLIFLGIPNSSVQFFTSQTDLFTTGCLYASLYFLFKALAQPRMFYYSLFGAGFGLALGAKGTIFYWGPGLLFLFIGLVFIKRPKVGFLLKGMAIASLMGILMGGFNYGRNYQEYGNPFAPSGSVQQSVSSTQLADVLFKSLGYTWQLFEPDSNMPILHPLTNVIFDNLQEYLTDPQKLPHSKYRKKFIRSASWLKYGLSEDYASFGLLIVLLSFSGGLCAWFSFVRSREQVALQLLVILSSVLLFMISFVFLQDWTVHRYRYFILLSPFLALLSTYFFHTLKFRGRYYLLALILISQSYMAFNIAYKSKNHGLSALIAPHKVGIFVLRDEITSLLHFYDEKPLRIGVVRPVDKWLAPFLRNKVGHEIIFYLPTQINQNQNLQQLLVEDDVDMIIADYKLALSYITSEVEMNFSPSQTLVAAKLIQPGEKVRGQVLRAGIYLDNWSEVNPSFQLFNWESKFFELTLVNPTPIKRQIIMESSTEKIDFILLPGDSTKNRVLVNQNDLVKMHISPAFIPSNYNNSSDNRSLGVKINTQLFDLRDKM